MDDPFPKELIPDIEKFFSSEESRPPGLDVYQDVFDCPYFFPLQRQREMAKMIQTAREYEPRLVYEIGADKGGGLYHWCKCLPTVERVIASEIRGTPYRDLFEAAFPRIEFLWIEGSSYSEESISRIKKWLGSVRIDVAFIDGDKSQFELDFDLILPMMATPSVVFMHDITDPAPGAAFERVVSRGYLYRKIVDTSDSHEAVRREKNKIPCSSAHEGWLRHWKGQSCGVGVIQT